MTRTGCPNTHPRSDRQVILRSNTTHPTPTPLATHCRLWQGSLNSKGYGRKWVFGIGMVPMHRWVMAQVYGWGAISDKVVMHLCDQPLCYRFDHLRLGDHADNSQDMMAKGRGVGQFRPNSGWTLKLSVEDVREIRRAYEAGEATQSELGRMFGVHRTTILRIIRYEARRAP